MAKQYDPEEQSFYEWFGGPDWFYGAGEYDNPTVDYLWEHDIIADISETDYISEGMFEAALELIQGYVDEGMSWDQIDDVLDGYEDFWDWFEDNYG